MISSLNYFLFITLLCLTNLIISVCSYSYTHWDLFPLQISAIAVNNNGTNLYVKSTPENGYDYPILSIYDISTKTIIKTIQERLGKGNNLALDEKNNILYIGQSNYGFEKYDLELNHIETIEYPRNITDSVWRNINSFVFSAELNIIYVSFANRPEIFGINPSTGEIIQRIKCYDALGDGYYGCNALAFDKNGNIYVSNTGISGIIYIYEAITGKYLEYINLYFITYSSMIINKDVLYAGNIDYQYAANIAVYNFTSGFTNVYTTDHPKLRYIASLAVDGNNVLYAADAGAVPLTDYTYTSYGNYRIVIFKP